jgi:hypothetical protein
MPSPERAVRQANTSVQRETVLAEMAYLTLVPLLFVTDPRRILAYGVLSTPGLVIDGTVASTGRIPLVDEIAGWLRPVPVA